MSTIRIILACKEFDRLLPAGSTWTDFSALQETALVASGLAEFVTGSATALPGSGQIPITTVQFQNPALFGFQAVDARLFLYNGVLYAGNGAGLTSTAAPAPSPGGGDASAANQVTGNASLANIDTDIGALDSTAAAADGTGNYGLIAAAKRSLLNWAALLTRIPTLGQKAMSGAVPVSIASDQTRVNVEPLGIPGVARQISATASSANTALTAGIRAISMHCRGANARYVVGSSAQTANASTSHWIADGERLDIDVPATAHIAVIRDSAATVNATIQLTELS